MAWSGARSPRLLLLLALALPAAAEQHPGPGSGPAGEGRLGAGGGMAEPGSPRSRRPWEVRLGAVRVAAPGMRCRAVPASLRLPAQ